MASCKREIPDWKQFEQLVARIEEDAGPLGLTVVSPDKIVCKITGRKREVDASIRNRTGTADVLITIECRKRHPKQDVTWIEQLAAKREAIGASCTIAVSSSGFTPSAEAVARRYGIQLRRLSDVSAAEINSLMRIDFVLFTHKRVALARAGLRFARTEQWKTPSPEDVDMVLPDSTEIHSPLFRNVDTNATWSLNDLWHQVQEAIDPFEDIQNDHVPVIRTACFPYPGNVVIETDGGPKILGDVLLSVALWLEVEQIDLDSARKVEYASPQGEAFQRIEFVSKYPNSSDWRISLQMPKNGTDLSQIKTGGNWPQMKDVKK
jgi:hypothetical protein